MRTDKGTDQGLSLVVTPTGNSPGLEILKEAFPPPPRQGAGHAGNGVRPKLWHKL
jgi:hypothetical protein